MNQTQSLRIALVGFGKMGKEIHHLASEMDMTIAAVIDPTIAEFDKPLNAESLEGIDVCIEFTQPDAAVRNIEAIARAGKNLVIGTTGWIERLDDVRRIVQECGIGLVYASNFSLGMNLFFLLVEEAAALFNERDAYDCFIHEAHHAMKKDMPSGTALTIAEKVVFKMANKRRIIAGELKDRVPKDALHIASSRGGTIPGVHTVTFDSLADTIELRHTARSRRGLAEGALLAAHWVHGKVGLFTMEDVLHG